MEGLGWILTIVIGGIIGQLVVAVIGACLLIWLYRLVRGAS